MESKPEKPASTAMASIFVVSAVDIRRVQTAPLPRVDLGLFFTREDAEAHLNRLHGSWGQKQIDERTVRQEELHESHAGLGGK